MTQVVSEFQTICYATTREECVAMMDKVGLSLLDDIGGAPWLVPDDDVKKIPAGDTVPTCADDQGFCYVGLRKYVFRGPVVGLQGATMHDGFKLQGHHDGY